jgi:hypothetical protein
LLACEPPVSPQPDRFGRRKHYVIDASNKGLARKPTWRKVMQLVNRMAMLIIMCACMASGLSSALAEPEQPVSEDCATIQAWVEANKERLPTTYEGLSRFSVTYRRAIFGTLPADIKSRLWRQHFHVYLANHPNLAPAQIAIVREMHALASPEFFARRSDDAKRNGATDRLRAEDDRRLAELEERAAELFSNHELTALMAYLGPAEEERQLQDSNNPLPMGIACECSTSSDWCASGYDCWHASCDVIRDACGSWWSYDCNGLCFRP